MCATQEDSRGDGCSSEMDAGLRKKRACELAGVMLEYSASNDLCCFKKAIEEGGAQADEPGRWYGRSIGSRKMAFEQRTPLMIAAMYGSADVLKFILATEGGGDVNAAGSDGATALHCAAAGGARSSVEIMKILVDAGADLNRVDLNGKCPSEVMARKVLCGRESFRFESEESGSSNSGSPRKEQTASVEKRDYPVDLSLPDIQTGIYGSDDFRMYSFKVKPCSRAYSHDWTECPFVHPGENARRRDPRKYMYSCVPCPEFRKGTCRQGDACEYAHGVFECWLHPAQYRTRLCKDETNCTRRVCFFAHKPEELRPLYPSTGSAVPSPRSSSGGLNLDVASLSPLSLTGPSMLMISPSNSPMSPSGSPMGGSSWPNQALVPSNLQLPSSRLKTSVSAWNADREMDLIGLEGIHHQQLNDDIPNLSLQTGRTGVLLSNGAGSLAAPAAGRGGKFGRGGTVAPFNLDEMIGSLSPSVSQLQGLSPAPGSQLHSPSRNGFQSSYSSSPMMSSASFSLEQSVAAAVLNAKSSTLAKRSQSFTDRSALNRYSKLHVSTAAPMSNASMLSDWSSPDGKLDWRIQSDELYNLRKSASFRSPFAVASVAAASTVGEPDLSWVQSLVKEAPQSASQGWKDLDCYGNEGNSEMPSPWVEQMYMEQEQMVA